MANPARELHGIYKQWRVKFGDQAKAMSSVVRPLTTGHEQVKTAAQLLSRIDALLTYFEKEGLSVSVYRKWAPQWWGPLLAYPNGWTGQYSAEVMIAEDLLDQLEGFAAFLDGKVYSLSEGGTSTLRSVLSEARALLEEDDSLDVDLREYIHRLLQLIQDALDDEAVGVATDIAEEVRRLWVALRAAEGVSDKKKANWKGIWTQIATATSAGALVEGGSILLKSITGGA